MRTANAISLIATLVSAGACGSVSGIPDASETAEPIDAPGTAPTPDAASTARIRVRVGNIPADLAASQYFAYLRFGDGPWAAAPRSTADPSLYEFEAPIGRYTFAVGCARAPGSTLRNVAVFELLTSDIQEWGYLAPCTPGNPGTLAGTLASIGAERFMVSLRQDISIVTPAQMYSVAVEPGTYDVVASMINLPLVAVRTSVIRDVQLGANANVPLNIAITPLQATVQRTVALVGGAGSVSSLFVTNNGTAALLSGDASEPYNVTTLAPAQVLPSDRHLYIASATVENDVLVTTQAVSGADAMTTVQLPPRLVGANAQFATDSSATYPNVVATWPQALTPTAYQLEASNRGAGTSPGWQVLISAGAMGESRTARLPDFSGIPGFPSEFALAAGATISTEVAALSSNMGMADLLSLHRNLPRGTTTTRSSTRFSVAVP